MADQKKVSGGNRWKKRLIKAGITLLSILAFLLLMDKVIMPWYVKRGDITTLPKVVGKPVEEAIRTLQDAGYEPIKYETQFDEKAKEGTIIRQTPEGGDETKPGRKVYLIISGGKEMVVIPNLSGLALRDARIALVRANLDIAKQEMEFSDSIPSGFVIRQSPPAGSKISSDQKINLVISNGSRAGKVEVPNLVDISFNEAILRLGHAKLGVGVRNQVQVPGKKIGAVVDQSPKPGELVLEGSAIDLWIESESSAPPANEN
jgi:beta-lactam-binding protein with PASTA domain